MGANFNQNVLTDGLPLPFVGSPLLYYSIKSSQHTLLMCADGRRFHCFITFLLLYCSQNKGGKKTCKPKNPLSPVCYLSLTSACDDQSNNRANPGVWACSQSPGNPAPDIWRLVICFGIQPISDGSSLALQPDEIAENKVLHQVKQKHTFCIQYLTAATLLSIW